MMRAIAFACLILGMPASPALAQLNLPLPQVPGLPSAAEVLDRAGVDGVVDGRALREVRALRIRALLRAHPDELEADPQGQIILRGRVLAWGVSEQALDAARANGFRILRMERLDTLGALATLQAPEGMSTRRALRRLRAADPEGVYDFDHVHLDSGALAATTVGAQAGASRAGPRIGLIDTGVDAQAAAAQRAFASETPVPAAHGTTVASLLATAAPGARIYAADIYGGVAQGGAASALARALAWLSAEEIGVVNVSLVGPRNRIVEAIVAQLVERGVLIVAAVGNDGPAAAPLYPAAYPGVVGVTGVDQRGRVLIEAGRGSQVDFAALGVVDDGSRRGVRGTSYAAPIVAGMLAVRAEGHGGGRAEQALQSLRTTARDLGARGRDDVFGHGLVDPAADLAAR